MQSICCFASFVAVVVVEIVLLLAPAPAHGKSSYSKIFNKLLTLGFETCFEKKFTCARTKCEAIAIKILAPNSSQHLQKDLLATKFVTVSVDCSNKRSLKLFPVLVRHFLPEMGVQIKLIHLHSTPGETADTLIQFLMKSITEYSIKGNFFGSKMWIKQMLKSKNKKAVIFYFNLIFCYFVKKKL